MADGDQRFEVVEAECGVVEPGTGLMILELVIPLSLQRVIAS